MRLIDADVLRNALRITGTKDSCKGCKHESHNWACCKDDLPLNYICEILDEQPTVDAVPIRHGMFVGTEYDGFADGNPVYYEWKCSECGCVFEEEEPTYRYCPQCGARMDEE